MNNNAFWIVLHKLRAPLLVIIITYSIAILGMVLIPGMDDNGNVYHLSFFDAFYFVSYMASTIGFGEAPYTFTYSQRLWVSLCIYITVVGWFYGIGALVSAVTDKTFKFELMKSAFRKKVRMIRGDFVIILGYTYVTAEIIKRFHDVSIEAVLIDRDEDKVSGFLLEDFSRDVPVMAGNALLTDTLKDAGITLKNCKFIVSLFDDEEKNLRVSILTRFLNSKVEVIAKSTYPDITKSILDTDIAKAINPFEIFAKRIDVAFSSPHVLLLENWIYRNSDLNSKTIFLPKGKYIVCGYGRFGKALKGKFEKHNLDYVFIDEKVLAGRDMIESGRFIRANADDKDVLIEAGIEDAVALIVGTKNDIDNLSIVITARKINPNIYIIARENTIQEVSLFQAANIDWVFIIETILINKTSLALTKPLKNRFLNLIIKKDEEWSKTLVKLLRVNIGINPTVTALRINEEESYAIYSELKNGVEVTIDILTKSRKDWNDSNSVIPLLIHRKSEEILIPKRRALEIGDHILFACSREAKDDIEMIASNIYELHYVMYGKEKESPILSRLFG